MKSKAVPVLFILAGALIAGIFLYTSRFSKKEEVTVNKAKIITPKSQQNDDSGAAKVTSSTGEDTFDSLIPLKSSETLISTLVLDMNLDTYDDEVIVVRKSGSQFLYIVAGLYNPETMSYERIAEIPTQISKTRTFSYTGMDIIGDHSNALVYQGDDDNGNYVMQIFLFKKDKNEIVEIGNFSSDGTIFIQQTERSESYELSLSKGDSFSVWVYKSDVSDSDATTKDKTIAVNQLQQEYKWNPVSEHYELANEIHVNANRLAAKELSRIQDGTIETFASFLDGLWYKTSNDDSVIRYIYFDYGAKEIIQVYGDIQEVYEWEDSRLRHNGIYLTTVNSSISTLHRRFDVALANVDEIKITIHDDINLTIKENTLWDGSYKKMSLQSSVNQAQQIPEIDQIVSELKKSDIWTSTDTLSTITMDGMKYSFTNDGVLEKGVFAPLQAGNYNILEFLSDSDYSMLNEMYSVAFGKKTITETIKKKKVEKVVTDTDTLIFIPVKITPTDCFEVEGKSFTFQRGRNE